ncbi:ABC transporter permease [Pararhodobacter sp. SW119]|uniref:ABC transporter permease n=1 Tax=Pararhodobacter sp. SW119 TaxID=2780075 RepID=UPI001AE03932|nr:ABC transporter permease [Pararhodobacter sp. SW119]
MTRFALLRLVQSLVSLFAITVIVFGLSHATGSPIDTMLPDDATTEQIAALSRNLGLDEPLWRQYLVFLGNALQGDFGMSLKWRGQSAMGVVLDRLPATLRLGGLALLISIAVAIPAGVVSAVRRGTWADHLVRGFALFGQSIPAFWLGIVLIWIFAVGLGWLPTSGHGGLAHMILPAISIAAFQIAALTRLTRSAMLEVLDTEYVKLARIKGASETAVVWRHAFANAAIVPLTYFGVLAGSVLTGSIVVETVFGWPGAGWLAIEAIRARDFPVIQAVVMFFALAFLLANVLVDLLYAWVDPRVRHG